MQGAAIGLLLVFRTDNAYRRLEEARDVWMALRTRGESEDAVRREFREVLRQKVTEKGAGLPESVWEEEEVLRDLFLCNAALLPRKNSPGQ